jgi:hypothetical protein
MTTRRNMIKKLGALAGGIFILPLTRGLSPDENLDLQRSSKTLLAFAGTVTPGVMAVGGGFTEIFDERVYGFRKFKWLLLTDLRNRSRRIFGNDNFAKLEPEQRHRVIVNALRTRGIMRRLYSGAIQITQVGYYSGYRCRPEGCTEIGFRSQFGYEPACYAEGSDFFGQSLTDDGNLT